MRSIATDKEAENKESTSKKSFSIVFLYNNYTSNNSNVPFTHVSNYWTFFNIFGF